MYKISHLDKIHNQFPDGFLEVSYKGKRVGYIVSNLIKYKKKHTMPDFLGMEKKHNINNTELYIGELHVEPNYRGKGLGEKLMRELIDTVSQKYDIQSVILYVDERLKPANGLYNKLGFEVVGSSMIHGSKYKNLIMRKTLKEE